MVNLPTFESFSSVFDLQDVVKGEDLDRAKEAMAITVCGASTTHQDTPDFLLSASLRLQQSLFEDLVQQGQHRGDFNTDLTNHDDNGNMTHAAAFLFPHRNESGDLMLSMLSAPVSKTYPDEANPKTMVGMLNSDACLRTSSFDEEGVLQGDVRFTILDYSST